MKSKQTIKILLVFMTVFVIAGCRSKEVKPVKRVTTSSEVVNPQKPIVYVEAQQLLRTSTNVTYKEDLLLSYTKDALMKEENYFYETNLSPDTMKISAEHNVYRNTVYIRKENDSYIVYPDPKESTTYVKYQLNDDFILSSSNNEVLHYLKFNIDVNSYTVKTEGNYTIYERTLKLKNLGVNKNMLDPILYHYTNEEIKEDVYVTDIKEIIVISNRDQSFKTIKYDLTNVLNVLNKDVVEGSMTYQINLSNYNEAAVKFPYNVDYVLDDAPDTFRNYIYYYSHITSNSSYKELTHQNVLSGHFDYVDDLDIYSFYVPVKSKININISSNSAYTYLITSDLNTKMSSSTQSSPVNYVKEFEAGRYYVLVKSKEVGDYQLTLSNNNKFASFIQKEIDLPLELTQINYTNTIDNELTYAGDLDVYELSKDSYTISFSTVEQVSLILVKKYEDYITYEWISKDVTSIDVTKMTSAKQYLLVYSEGYFGEYNLNFALK